MKINVDYPLSNIISIDRQIQTNPSVMPIDQQHPHQAKDHIVPTDNGQHLHGQTSEIPVISGNGTCISNVIKT